MIENIFKIFSQKPLPQLSEVDELYRDTITKLSTEEKLAYCKRQLEAVEFDLKKQSTRYVPQDKRRVQILKNEIANLYFPESGVKN